MILDKSLQNVYHCRNDDKVYDYCYSSDAVRGQTYVVYQNVFRTRMAAGRASSACPETDTYASPTYDAPEIVLLPCTDETCTDEKCRGECKLAAKDADDQGYIDPAMLHPTRSSTNPMKVRRPQKPQTSSSDSESDEKEMVDIQLKEYAHSLRVKRKTKRRDCRESVHWSPKRKSVSNGRPKSTKKDGENNGYMMMQLTPEIWEILKNHTNSMKAAKRAKVSETVFSEVRPRLSRGQLTRQKSVSSDDEDIYIEVTG